MIKPKSLKILQWIYLLFGICFVVFLSEDLNDNWRINFTSIWGFILVIIGIIMPLSFLWFSYTLFQPSSTKVQISRFFSYCIIFSCILALIFGRLAASSSGCEGFGCMAYGFYFLFLVPSSVASVIYLIATRKFLS